MKLKPPLSLAVKGLNSFARLALALTEAPPLVWHFKLDGKSYAGIFFYYISWRGDVPVFAYIPTKEAGPFLAYKCDMDKEESMFVNNMEDTKYAYAPVIFLKKTPKIFRQSIEKKAQSILKPLNVELESLNSMVRLLYLISIREFNSFPIWRVQKGEKYVLGVFFPFEHYYESLSLPIFFYVTLDSPSSEPFLRYSTSKFMGEILEYSETTGDTKFFYTKVVDVEDMPLFSA